MSFENLDKLIYEISKLKQAHKFLERIWVIFRYYELEEFFHVKDVSLSREIADYFGFDDSE